MRLQKLRNIVCFKKSGIKYVDYKDPDFLMRFINEQGKDITKKTYRYFFKYQRKVAVAVKRATSLSIMPYVADLLK